MKEISQSDALPEVVHLIHLHETLVLSVDRLVCNQAGGSDHGLRHSCIGSFQTLKAENYHQKAYRRQ